MRISKLHEQLKLLGLTKMGERAKLIGALHSMEGTGDRFDDHDQDGPVSRAKHLMVHNGRMPTKEEQTKPTTDWEQPASPQPPQPPPQAVKEQKAPPATLLLHDDDLSEAQCVALLKDLIEAYQQPEFVSKLRTFQREHGVMFIARVGPLVLEAQRPVFQRHGLLPDASSVDKMKMAIHRRIAEGTPEAQRRLELLANAARRCLGIPPIPDTRSRGSAEEVFAQMLSGKMEGITAPSEAASSHQGVEAAVNSARARGVISAAACTYLTRKLSSRRLEPLVVLSLLSMAECGLPTRTLSGADRHLFAGGITLATTIPSSSSCEPRPLQPPMPHALSPAPGISAQGSSSPSGAPRCHVPLVTALPSAASFFEQYVLPSRPCVLRLSELSAQRWPPLHELPDFDFLRRRCGHRRVPVKSLALDDAQGRPCLHLRSGAQAAARRVPGRSGGV